VLVSQVVVFRARVGSLFRHHRATVRSSFFRIRIRSFFGLLYFFEASRASLRFAGVFGVMAQTPSFVPLPVRNWAESVVTTGTGGAVALRSDRARLPSAAAMAAPTSKPHRATANSPSGFRADRDFSVRQHQERFPRPARHRCDLTGFAARALVSRHRSIGSLS
jgi:hypothetical protein